MAHNSTTTKFAWLVVAVSLYSRIAPGSIRGKEFKVPEKDLEEFLDAESVYEKRSQILQMKPMLAFVNLLVEAA